MSVFKTLAKSVKSVFSPFGLLSENGTSLIAFEMIFRMLVYLVLFPILTWSQRLWLIGNRTNVIAWYNAGSFVKNPMTWIVMILMMFLMSEAAIFEQFAIYDTLHAGKFEIRKTVRQIFSSGFDMCIERLRPENWGMIPYVLIVLNFGTPIDVSSVTSVIQVPGFILEDFEKNPERGAVYVIFTLAAAYFYLRWLFAIPIMMEEDSTSFSKACQKSASMIKGRYFVKIFFLALFWWGLTDLLYVGMSAGIVGIWYLLSLWVTRGHTDPFIEFFFDRYAGTSMIFYIFFIWMLLPLMAASFQCAYYRRKEELGEEILKYTEAPHFFHRYPALKWGILAICAVSIFFSVPGRYAQITWMLNTDYGNPMIMAHRGFSAAAPENTIPAFRMCIENDFSAAELDVQMLKDGTIIVLHDDNLKRTTGINKNVWEVTYDEIRDLDNGRFFSEEFEGTTIPTLDEVIKLAASGKQKLYLNIEIKRNGHDEGITQKVVDIIEENNYLDNCDITSQDYQTLEEVREINPYVLTAYTSVIGIGDIETLDAADIISIQQTFATYQNIERIHSAGKHVFVWTVNEQDTMEELVNLNVDAILTNDPNLCKKVIDDRQSDVMNIVRRLKSAFAFL